MLSLSSLLEGNPCPLCIVDVRKSLPYSPRQNHSTTTSLTTKLFSGTITAPDMSRNVC